jgi:hypothetical protein
MGFEDNLARGVFNPDQEKNKLEKILTEKDIIRLRELISNETLNTLQVSEIMNILVSTELKLTNFGDRDRYILGKYLIWYHEYGKRYMKALRAKELYSSVLTTLPAQTQNLRQEIEKEYTETFRTATHIYCFLVRSPLSIGSGLIKQLTTQKQDINYSGLPTVSGQPSTQKILQGGN